MIYYKPCHCLFWFNSISSNIYFGSVKPCHSLFQLGPITLLHCVNPDLMDVYLRWLFRYLKRVGLIHNISTGFAAHRDCIVSYSDMLWWEDMITYGYGSILLILQIDGFQLNMTIIGGSFGTLILSHCYIPWPSKYAKPKRSEASHVAQALKVPRARQKVWSTGWRWTWEVLDEHIQHPKHGNLTFIAIEHGYLWSFIVDFPIWNIKNG